MCSKVIKIPPRYTTLWNI